MNAISSVHRENCTVRNALLWGMYQSHHYQAYRVQNPLCSRILHLALAVLEAIPIIGQIISLIELKIVQAYTRSRSISYIDSKRCALNASPQSISNELYSSSSCTGPQQKNVYTTLSQPISSKLINTPSNARPQPTSCVPQMTTIVSQETAADVRRIWPTDLKLLGLTESQKTDIDRHVRDAFRAGELFFSKKRLKYTDGTQTVDLALPITMNIRRDMQADFQVLLFPKTIFASGGERKIRWAYDLTNGVFLLKKRITGLFEEQLLKYLIPLRMKRGMETSIIWRTSSGKQNEKKLQIIEPVRDGTLAVLFGTAPLSNFSVKRDLIMDLLNDVSALHTGHLTGVKINSTRPSFSEKNSSQELSYGPFHSDITLLNVLVFFQNEKWRAELCDFGAGAAHPTVFGLSIGYTPPEYIRFYREKRPLGIQSVGFDIDLDDAKFIIEHGQGRDIWSLGLVILSLLVEREEEAIWENVFEKCHKKANIPPLQSFKTALSGRLWSRYDEEYILNFKQEVLDADLDQLEKEAVSKHPKDGTELKKLFEMLKGMMLRIDPNERKTIGQCLAFLN